MKTFCFSCLFRTAVLIGLTGVAALFMAWPPGIYAVDADKGKNPGNGKSPDSDAIKSTAVAPPAIWSPDNGDGTYKNPIIYADYSDPDVIRVGDDFYLTASSFSCFPGLPVLHSKDLVNWTIIGHAINKHPVVEQFAKPFHGGGMWAPAIRYHDGAFYIFVGDPDNGIYMVKAKNPAGPWDPPILVKKSKGWIDTCPFWDDDGQAYLIHAFAGSRAGINNILHINRMSTDGTKLLDEGKLVVDGNGSPYHTIEGPKLYKRNNYYYIMAPGGGVARGYQIAFRSKNVYGPYESRIVLDRGLTSVNGPHQGGWVETHTGEGWFVHFQEYLPYGRIVHLQPVRWVDDWPIMGEDPDGDGKGQPVLTHRKPNVGRTYPIAVPQTSDEFDAPKLGLQWQWFANFIDDWISLTDRHGFLRMAAVTLNEPTPLSDHPNLLLQKFPAEQFMVTTRIDLTRLEDGDRIGLVIAGRATASLQVLKTHDGLKIIRTVSDARQKPGPGPSPADREEDSAAAPGEIVFLRVKVVSHGVCTFSYSSDGSRFSDLDRPFTAVNDHWIGAKVGLFCDAPAGRPSTGQADVDWFRFAPVSTQ
ncbi:MAG: glycoside hydrolase 43 family protein [Thermoguttaceae bacterium]|jgi:beta-xylosidase